MLDCRDYDLAVVDRIKSFYDNTHWINRSAIPIKEIRDRKLLDGKEIEFPIITLLYNKILNDYLFIIYNWDIIE